MDITLLLLKNEISNLEWLTSRDGKRYSSGEQARQRAIAETRQRIKQLASKFVEES